MENIYVIVENVDKTEWGEAETIEALCAQEGYFIDEKDVEKRVDVLNAKYVEQQRESHEHYTEAALEEWETRFGYIPLEY